MKKHLWEVDHPYYCNLGNYHSNDCGHEYKSFASFLEDWDGMDMDLNLLFRWDWKENDERAFTGDVNYRNGQLEIFWMLQRKGNYQYCVVEVCRADEPAVRAFLEPRWAHLQKLWTPIGNQEDAQ